MKTDLASSIGVAIAGILIAYFVCNLFTGSIDDVTIKTVDSSFSTDIADPNPEVFNYRAINPTVEVYVGNDDNCTEFDDDGQCIDGSTTNPNQGNP